jgi:hypothetical protein
MRGGGGGTGATSFFSTTGGAARTCGMVDRSMHQRATTPRRRLPAFVDEFNKAIVLLHQRARFSFSSIGACMACAVFVFVVSVGSGASRVTITRAVSFAIAEYTRRSAAGSCEECSTPPTNYSMQWRQHILKHRGFIITGAGLWSSEFSSSESSCRILWSAWVL